VTLTAAVIALLLWGASNDTLDLSAGERLGSFGGESRIEVISQFWTEYVLPHPALGIGFLKKEGYSDIQRGDPHNSLLLVWIEQGTIGLALLLLSLCITFRKFQEALRAWPRGSVRYTLLRHALFAQIALLLDALTVANLWTHHAIIGFDFALRIG